MSNLSGPSETIRDHDKLSVTMRNHEVPLEAGILSPTFMVPLPDVFSWSLLVFNGYSWFLMVPDSFPWALRVPHGPKQLNMVSLGFSWSLRVTDGSSLFLMFMMVNPGSSYSLIVHHVH